MALSPTSGVPKQIEIGNSASFLLSYADFAPGTYTLTFILSLGTAAPASTTATTSGTQFLVSLSTAVTTALTAGIYQWATYATASGVRYTADTGSITVLPNLAATQAASFAQAQVTLLQTVLAAFNATDKKIVDFNGQRFERQSVAEYQKQYVFWKAQLLSEQSALAAQRGESKGGRIAAKFVSPVCQ